jgi:hypothetical protein
VYILKNEKKDKDYCIDKNNEDKKKEEKEKDIIDYN